MSILKNLRINYSYSAVIFAASLIIFGYSEIILPLILAVIIHELGHLSAILLCGGNAESLSVNMGGFVIGYSSSHFTFYEDIICAVSGPVFGFIAAFLASKWGFTVFSGICFSINIFNMIPVRPLDGGRVLWSFLVMLMPVRGETICRIIESIILCVLALLAMYIAYKTGNFSLLYIAIVLTFYYCKER